MTHRREVPARGVSKGGTQTWDPPRRTIPRGWSCVCFAPTPGSSKKQDEVNWGRRPVPHTRRQQSVF